MSRSSALVAPALTLALGCLVAGACGTNAAPNNAAGGGDAGSGSSSGSSSGGSSSGSSSGGSSSGGSSSGSSSGGSSSGSSSDGGDDGGTGPADAGTLHQGDGGKTNGIPDFGQVYLILMENEDSTSVVGNSSAPYINGTLLTEGAYTTAYTAITHPSLPNYIALTSGGTQGIVCDCPPIGSTACTAGCAVETTPTCNCGGQGATNLGAQLTAAGLMWRNYGEDMGTPCNTTNSGNYAVRHVPFLYYSDVASSCAEHVVNFSHLAGDLGSYPFSFITPNLCDDGSDDFTDGGTNTTNDEVQQSDAWLQANVSKIMNAPEFSTNGVLFITWDEGADIGTNTVLTIALGPFVKPGAVATAYNHYSMLATIEDGLGLARIGSAVGATSMADMFK